MKKILFVSLILIVLIGCSKNQLTREMPVEDKMNIAEELFDQGKYHKAIPYYTNIVLDRNSIYTAKAQMKLGDCYFYQDNFLEARFEYEELIRLFKNYEDISKAYFNIGVCYFEESLSPHYTQEETEKAIISFETFIEKFPFDERIDEALDYLEKCEYKLLEKKYNNGYAYFKMYDYSSALLYFDEITALNIIDKIDKMSLFYSGRIYIARKDKANALLIVDKMNTRYPDYKETKKINNLFKKLK
ncbi:MAG: outer membrane protein assembly factor BamD, partial [Candidatus Cloacimonetes bacterium]|nr:outer membrane protein assembly factor BamD [Candidatus Cloacimonadota bacterium]